MNPLGARRGAARWRRVALVALAVPLLAELGLRATLAARGTPYACAAARERLSRIVGELALPVDAPPKGEPPGESSPDSALHPFYAFESARGADDVAAQAQVARLARPEERAAQAVVLVLGGSVADNFAEHGFPPLREQLAADARLAGRELILLRHGRPAFKAPQPTMLCAWLFSLGIVPDVVVLIDGFNDVALASYNAGAGVHPAYPSVYHWGAIARGLGTESGYDHALRTRAARVDALGAARAPARALGGLALRSALYGAYAVRRAERLRERWSDLHVELVELVAGDGRDPVVSGPPFREDEALAIACDAWERQSRALDGLCRAFGARFLHVLQPTLHDEGSKPLTEEERALGASFPAVVDGARLGYPMLRDRLGRLRERGLAVHDASRVFADHPETLYFDMCHFGREGNAILARELAPRIGEQLAARPR